MSVLQGWYHLSSLQLSGEAFILNPDHLPKQGHRKVSGESCCELCLNKTPSGPQRTSGPVDLKLQWQRRN